jgi:biopolymer transport protein ExbB/TolQ
MTLMSLIGQGWVALVPLLVCSVLVIAVILERVWTYSHVGQVPKELVRRIEGLVLAGDNYEAIALLDDYDSAYSRIMKASLAKKNASQEEINDILVITCDAEISSAQRPLPILGTIGNIAPFLGLLGTVIGIMMAFRVIAVKQSAGFSVIGSQLAMALIATAFGLGVGIVSVIANNWCNAWVDRYRLDLERFSTDWSYRLQHLLSQELLQQTIEVPESKV